MSVGFGNKLKTGSPVEHIAIILDGNRRWASGKELNPGWGIKQGADTVENLLDWCQKLNVKYVTLYTFSTENFTRITLEIQEIMRYRRRKIPQTLN